MRYHTTVPIVCGILAVALAFSFSRSHAESAADRDGASDIAVCSLIAITNDLMESDRFKPARLEFETKIRQEEIGPLVEQGKALEMQLRGIVDQESDEAKMIQQQLMLLRDRLMALQQNAGIRFEQFTVLQSIEAYELAKTSAEAIAKDLGFEYLLCSTSPDEPIKPGPMVTFVNEVLSRNVLMAPDGVDISADVRDDLKLPG